MGIVKNIKFGMRTKIFFCSATMRDNGNRSADICLVRQLGWQGIIFYTWILYGCSPADLPLKNCWAVQLGANQVVMITELVQKDSKSWTECRCCSIYIRHDAAGLDDSLSVTVRISVTVTGNEHPKSSTLFISVSSTTNDDCIIDADIVGVPSGVPERLKRKIAPLKWNLSNFFTR